MIARTKIGLVSLIKLDFIRFCMVGGTGFIINVILLSIFHKLLQMPIFFAQLLAAEVALFSNFMLHNHWTYKAKRVKKKFIKLLIQFHATSWPAILASAAMVAVGVKLFHLNPSLALIISSTIALAWNFLWSKYVIWHDTSVKEINELTN